MQCHLVCGLFDTKGWCNFKGGIVIAAYSACFSEYLSISTEHAAIWLMVKGKSDIDIGSLQFAGMSAVHDAVQVAIGLGQNFDFCTILPQLQWRILCTQIVLDCECCAIALVMMPNTHAH